MDSLDTLVARYPRVRWRQNGYDVATGRHNTATFAVFRARGAWSASCQLHAGAPVVSVRGHASPVAALDALSQASLTNAEILYAAPVEPPTPKPTLIDLALLAIGGGWALFGLVVLCGLLLCAVAA